MIRILTYKEIDRTEWSKLVRESRTGTWFQGPEAYEFFASMPELFRPFAIAIYSIYRENINIDKPSYAAINIDKEEIIKNAHSTSVMPDGPRGLERNHPQTPTSELAASVDANTPNMLPECSTLNAYENATPSSENGKNGELRGVCVGYVTKEKSRLKQYFMRRAIILGGPVFSGSITEEEVYELMSAVRKQLQILDFRFKILNSPIYIETRNFNDYSRWKEAFERAGFTYKKHLNFHVDCTDEEAMWERLSENRKRQVRKALTDERMSGLVDEREIREWYEILEELYRTKVKTPLWPVEFFLEAYRQGVGKFLLVKHEGKVIGGSMVVVKKPTPNPSLKGREHNSFASVWGAHTADSTQYDLLKANAQANRKAPTEAETILWDMLKGNNIGLHFRRQHIILDYIVDFVCIEKGLVIELDGGYHTNPEQVEHDKQRTAHLRQLGYTELRFTNEELLVKPEKVIAKIKAAANSLPSLQGRTEKRPGTIYEWFECGRNAEYKEQYPSVMATWAGMKLAHEMGCARYDMMGAGEPGVPYGVRDFKSEFGGTMVEHGRFLCVCKPLLYKIGVLAVRLLKRSK